MFTAVYEQKSQNDIHPQRPVNLVENLLIAFPFVWKHVSVLLRHTYGFLNSTPLKQNENALTVDVFFMNSAELSCLANNYSSKSGIYNT
jgi:hypothetical protein